MNTKPVHACICASSNFIGHMGANKTALVSGGISGLDFAICLAMSKQNAHVVLTARDPEKGQQ
jgi:NAD(P)-dependent dehydrogenase (short-subunit alcohol dehydrogenase family)